MPSAVVWNSVQIKMIQINHKLFHNYTWYSTVTFGHRSRATRHCSEEYSFPADGRGGPALYVPFRAVNYQTE